MLYTLNMLALAVQTLMFLTTLVLGAGFIASLKGDS
jgi:hypothetical protein